MTKKRKDKKPLKGKSPGRKELNESYSPSEGNKSGWLIFTAIVSSLALYANSIDNEFVYDDLVAVVQNPDVLGERPLKNVLINDFWGGALSRPGSHKSYRPCTILLYRIVAALSGTRPLNAKAFHALNCALNAITVGLAINCVNIISGDGKMGGKIAESGGVPIFVIVSSALYTFHPVHTESVDGIVGCADLLATFWGLLAFICHDKSQKTAEFRSFIRPLLASLVFSWLSALSKEVGLMILGVMGAREVSRHWLQYFGSRPSSSATSNLERTMFLSSILRFTLLALTGVAFLLFRRYINGEKTVIDIGQSICDNPLVTATTPASYALTALFVLCLYIWRLVNPFVLICDYGYNTIPLIETVKDIRNLAILFVLAGTTTLVMVGFREAMHKERSDGRIILALAFIFVPLLPASHIMSIGTVLAERLLYLPSLGYCLLVGLGAERIQTVSRSAAPKSKRTKYFKVAERLLNPSLVVVLALFSQRIFSRNKDWKDNRTLWTIDHFSNPRNVKLAKAYASELEVLGKFDEAYHIMKNMTGLGPLQRVEVCLVKSRSTALSKEAGKNFQLGYEILNECIAEVEQAPEMTTNSHQLYGSVGYLLSFQGKTNEAIPYFEKAAAVAAKVDKNNMQPICNVGEIYGRAHRHKEAVEKFEQCVAWGERSRDVKEKRAPSLANLGWAYMQIGQYEKAEAALKKSINLFKTDMAVRNLNELRKIMQKADEASQKVENGQKT